MSTNLARTADGWWVLTAAGLARLPLLAGLLPPATRWKLFFNQQAANPRYLHDGDVITATIASPDGRLDLGTQHNTIIRKLS